MVRSIFSGATPPSVMALFFFKYNNFESVMKTDLEKCWLDICLGERAIVALLLLHIPFLIVTVRSIAQGARQYTATLDLYSSHAVLWN